MGRRRRIVGLLAVALLASTVLVAARDDPADSAFALAPVADAYVTSANPNTNFGSTDSLRVDTAPHVVRSFVKFDLGSSVGNVLSAALRVYAGAASAAGYQVSGVTDTSWSESVITHSNAPTIGALIGSSGAFKASRWTEIDVTAAVRGKTAVTFALSGLDSTAVRLLSRESARAPQLVIESSGPPPTSAPPTTFPATTLPPGGTDVQPGFPMRGAFYYPWFPQAWTQGGAYPFTNYEPSLGYYDGADINVVRAQIAAMQYGNIQMAISSWWGQGHHTDLKFPTLLRAADGTTFRWALYYEAEGSSDRTVAEIAGDLTYLKTKYGSDPSALRIGGRLVVFVYADANDACGMADRWKAANTMGVYIVLKVFSGYSGCASQPDGWHQYGPATAAAQHGSHSYVISPGFWKKGEQVRLARDLSRWNENIRAMVASGARFQLVTTFNEWGEGSSVESATQWATPSGYGAYLDALHVNGAGGGPPPSTTAPPPTTSPPPTTTEPPSGDIRIAAVGDIACDPTSGSFNGGLGSGTNCRHKLVADIVTSGAYAAFLPLGDIQYEDGAYDKFVASYDQWFEPVNDITKPAVGNHEYLTSGAAGYFRYFGAAAGDPTKGYYSYDVGSWHLVALNSNCSQVGGCSAGSAQERWLRQDLAASGATCTIVYWHHPRYSSGQHGDATNTTPLYQAAYDYGVELVLSGHDHNYERFAPQDANGSADPLGVRQFVVGTGGRNHYPVGSAKTNSEVRNDNTFGALELTLKNGSYSWRFVPVAGQTFTDSGSETCH